MKQLVGMAFERKIIPSMINPIRENSGERSEYVQLQYLDMKVVKSKHPVLG